MNQKVKVEASTDNNILIFRITGRIWQGELASMLRLNIDNAIANNINTVHVFMSSEGGSVFEAEDVKIEFKRMANRKLVVGALAASAATNIMEVFGDNVECYSTSQFMIHKPSTWISGNEDQVEADLKLLKNITQHYRGNYAKRFNKTEEEIETLWKQDYWMNAQQAKELGLVKTIIDENLEINQEMIDRMVACGCPNIPTPTAQTPPENSNENNTMDINQLRAALGMSADATEEQVLAKAKELKSTADSAAANMAITAEQKRKAAETVIDKAILVDKKITAEQRESFIALHINDSANTEALLATMKGVTPASAGIKETPEGGDAESLRANWTLEDYLEKDPNALDALIQTNPEKVRQLNAAYAAKK